MSNWLRNLVRDENNLSGYRYLYHAGPDRITRFRAFSVIGHGKERYSGVYFSENYRSLIEDWMSHIFSKKNKDKSRSDVYKTIYIITVKCPEWVYRKSKDMQHDVFLSEQSRGEDIFGFWGWGLQTFVPEELLSHLEIINSKSYSWADVLSIMKDRYRHKSNLGLPSDPRSYGFSRNEEGYEKVDQYKQDRKDRNRNLTVEEETRSRNWKEVK